MFRIFGCFIVYGGWKLLPASDFHDLLMNLLGGAVAVGLGHLIRCGIKNFWLYNFKQIFGDDIGNFNIIYGELTLNPRFSRICHFPYVKPQSQEAFGAKTVASVADTRALKYISELYSKVTGKNAHLVSDQETLDKIDISYCSIGARNNLKTIQVLGSSQNKFFEYTYENLRPVIVNKKNGEKIYFIDTENDLRYDYAVIIKIKHYLFPNKTQICIAGLGEDGTRGGAWFLANKWKEIRAKTGDDNFGVVIRVTAGSDESAELVDGMSERTTGFFLRCNLTFEYSKVSASNLTPFEIRKGD